MLNLAMPNDIDLFYDKPDMATSFHRMTRLFRSVEGAWALAVFENLSIRQQIADLLDRVLHPIPIVEFSLADRIPDPLAILKDVDVANGQPAPVVSFTDVHSGFPELFGYLDLQRDTLALFRHRLLFWVTDSERRILADRAPNFFSRLSGTFWFAPQPADSLAEHWNSAGKEPATLEQRKELEKQPRVVLIYAAPDIQRVRELYKWLAEAGFRPWMDREDIPTGEDWGSAIERAIRASDFVLVCLSSNSFSRSGLLQKELKMALKMAQKEQEDGVFLIPVRLEDSVVPHELRYVQSANLFEEGGRARLLRALQAGTERHRRTR